MKKIFLTVLTLFVLGTISFSQNKQLPQKNTITHASHVHNGIIRCATMEADSILRAQHPELGTLNQQEAWLQQKIQEHKKKYDGQQKLPILTIPVVVHVIHNGDAIGSGENIPDGQVLSQIQVLNEDFRKILGTPGYNNNPVGADVEIEFCMAVIDPNGNPTNGIDRVNLGQATYSGSADVDANVKPVTIWDPTQYLNMWTVNFGGAGILGYAQFPDNSGLPGLPASGGAANTDGVVANYATFGSSTIFPGGTYSPPYDKGRTMTHEVGHWLGLRHTWGDANCGSDFCADTPETQTGNYGCPTQTTCDGIQDMVENYMDYTNDLCMNIFTEDQKTRMRTVMDVSPRRMELKNSTKCTPPNPDDGGISDIISPNGTVCGSTTFTPEVTLTNYGNNDITSIDIIYDIDGTGTQTFNWTGTLAPSSSVNVTLPNMTTTPGNHTFNANTNLPNGNTDSNTANDGTSVTFTISNGTPLTLTINTDCWGYEVYWEVQDASATVVTFGGNTGTNIPPGGGQTAQNTDAGAYGNETTITENLCLTNGCYDLIMYDDYGDGMGGGSGCATVGDYTLTDDATGTQLVPTVAGTSYTNSNTTNFCVGPPCVTSAGTMDTTPLTICGNGSQTATHNGDNVNDGNDALQFILHDVSGTSIGTIIGGPQNTPTFSFGGSMSYGTTYYISAISGDDTGGGIVDLSDPCLSIAAGTPVTWYNFPTVTANATATSICSGDPVTLTGSGATSYVWDNGVTDGVAFNPTSTTNYTVTGTDANGCTNTDNITVTVNPTPAFTVASTNPTTCGGNGDIILSGLQANTTYQVTYADNGSNIGPSAMTSDASGDITINVPAGTYSNFIVDLSGCTGTDNSTVSLSDPASFTVSTMVVDETCTNANGEITINVSGGTNPFQYSIDNGTNYVSTNVFTGLSAGTYNIAVQDSVNCTSFSTVTITDTPAPVISNVTTTDASCSGNDGTVTITATGNNLMYDIDGGTAQASNSFTGLGAGTYTVNVSNGTCTTSQTFTINSAAAMTVSSTITNPSCGESNGEISLSVSNGTQPYTVAWSHDTNLTTTTATGLSGGTYNYTVSDASGCSVSGSDSLAGDSNSMMVYASAKNVSCKGEADGYAVVDSVAGGTPPYTYLWDNGISDLSIANLTENIYTVTVTDNSGCDKTKAVVVGFDSEECLNVHNAISPNGDGQNDTWVVTGIKGYDESKVQIFNRWGALIYESDNYNNDWNGTYKGKDLPDGIYYFIVTVKNDTDEEPTVLNGSITIIR